jgi:DNA-binding MarR family transcriptional regulator
MGHVAAGRSWECLCADARKLSRCLTRIYNEILVPAKIELTQYDTLSTLGTLGAVSLIELARVSCSDRTTVLRNIMTLKKHGWVRVATNKRGISRVALTTKGRAVLRRARRHWSRADHLVRGELGVVRARELQDALREGISTAQSILDSSEISDGHDH